MVRDQLLNIPNRISVILAVETDRNKVQGMLETFNGKRIRRSTGTSNLPLAKAFNLAVKEWGWVRENPLLKVSREKESWGRDRWLADDEEKKLLDSCPQWWRDIVLFNLHIGLRQDELLSLEWSRVDLFRRTLG